MLRNKKNKIVVGIVGLGVGAFHLKNSLLNKNTFVKYICDTNETRLQILLQKNLMYQKQQKTLIILLMTKM